MIGRSGAAWRRVSSLTVMSIERKRDGAEQTDKTDVASSRRMRSRQPLGARCVFNGGLHRQWRFRIPPIFHRNPMGDMV